MGAPLPQFWDNAMPVTECGCWIWMAGSSGDGYGIYRSVRAHRYSWRMHFGKIPPGMHVLHRCDVPLCVNPDHLFLGTHAENMGDKQAKGRCARGENHPDARLTAADVRAIRLSSETNATLAERYGVGLTTVWKARNGRTWRSVPSTLAAPI